MRDKKSERTFYYFNTHLDHRGNEARQKGAEMNVKMMQRIAGKHAVIFHSGDMNSQRGTTTEAYLQPYDNWMKSARERAVESDQRATFDGFGKSQPRWLDHIFYRHAKAVKYATLDGKDYEMRDCLFPTIDPENPYQLTEEDEDIVQKLHKSFTGSEKLRKHMKCIFRYGCMYNVCNSNLLFHASMPMNADGTLKEVDILGKKYKGEALLKRVGQLIRTAYFAEEDNPEKAFARDFIWYLWCGKNSPAFDKSKMATFERYFLTDKETHKEVKGYYYTLRDREDICDMILDEFGVEGEHRHIINGHVPVKAVKGEKPIKANGKLMVIDGGFSKAYQPETGIAGYTLVYHSRGFQLVQHEPFTSTQKAIEEGQDIKSTTQIVELSSQRMMVKDTDKGRELMVQIEDLKKLLVAYQNGIIKERGI